MNAYARERAKRLARVSFILCLAGGALIGYEYGWITGLAVFFLAWAVSPVVDAT